MSLSLLPSARYGGCGAPVSALPSHSRRLNSGAVVRRGAPHAVCSAAVNAPPPQRKIRVKMASYYKDLLQESVEMLREATEETGARMTGPVPLPMRKKIWTVLRSPHVNKDSREQFERRTYFRLVELKDLSSKTVDRLMQLDLPAGVDIDVKLM